MSVVVPTNRRPGGEPSRLFIGNSSLDLQVSAASKQPLRGPHRNLPRKGDNRFCTPINTFRMPSSLVNRRMEYSSTARLYSPNTLSMNFKPNSECSGRGGRFLISQTQRKNRPGNGCHLPQRCLLSTLPPYGKVSLNILQGRGIGVDIVVGDTSIKFGKANVSLICRLRKLACEKLPYMSLSHLLHLEPFIGEQTKALSLRIQVSD